MDRELQDFFHSANAGIVARVQKWHFYLVESV